MLFDLCMSIEAIGMYHVPGAAEGDRDEYRSPFGILPYGSDAGLTSKYVDCDKAKLNPLENIGRSDGPGAKFKFVFGATQSATVSD